MSPSGEDIPILRGEEIRQLPERRALVIAENSKPIIAKLTRCLDGKPGQALLNQQKTVRQQLAAARRAHVPPDARATAAVVAAQRHGLTDAGRPR